MQTIEQVLPPFLQNVFIGARKPIVAGHGSNSRVAVNSSATLTAAQVLTGYITCTSTSAVTMKLPTGTLLGAAMGAEQGDTLDLFIDNTASSSSGIVTIAVGANGILSALAAAGGGSAAGLLTVPVGVTGIACFRLMFTSATAYAFTRIA